MIENSVQDQSNNHKLSNQPKMFKKLEKIELKYTKIVFTFSDLGVGFFGAHHSFPIFMPFPKWYNTFSPHLTWRLSLFFRRVNVIHILGPIYSLYFAASFSRLLIGKCIQILKQTAWQCWLLLEYIFGTSLKTSKLFCLLSIVVFRF